MRCEGACAGHRQQQQNNVVEMHAASLLYAQQLQRGLLTLTGLGDGVEVREL